MSIKWGKPIFVPLSGTTSATGGLNVDVALGVLPKGHFFRLTQVVGVVGGEPINIQIFHGNMTGYSYDLDLYGQKMITWMDSLIFPDLIGWGAYIAPNHIIVGFYGCKASTAVYGYITYQKGEYIG